MTLTAGSLLSATHLSLLKEALGITNFLLPPSQQCSRDSSDYKPETADQPGWKVGKTLPCLNTENMEKALYTHPFYDIN